MTRLPFSGAVNLLSNWCRAVCLIPRNVVGLPWGLAGKVATTEGVIM
jgi:hypothetical protein